MVHVVQKDVPYRFIEGVRKVKTSGRKLFISHVETEIKLIKTY